ncbi:hypothetical protein F9K33_09565 [bacterium]|nr:MAG: hypothetical protein F9K33_09565 [bacterium]
MKPYIYIAVFVFWTACDSSEKHTISPPQLKGKIVYSKPIVSLPLRVLVARDLDSVSEQYISDSTDGYGSFNEPNWSPDGNRIVCTFFGFEGPFKLFIYVNSKKYVTLSSYFDYEPLWSPGGDKILSSVGYFTFQIIDTISNTVYYNGPDSSVWNSKVVFLKKGHVRWNTEEEIFLVATPHRPDYPPHAQHDSLREIYRYNYVTETLVERMTNNLLDESNFEISSDRQRIVFSRGYEADKITYLMNISDTSATPIIQGKHETVRWFGKTHYLYYVRFPNPTVYVMDTDHPEKEYELMPVYDANIDIWAQPDSVGD